jgi:transcription initiation factor TFIIIB Brf1 subunit/transcription initiation factor TFIIB
MKKSSTKSSSFDACPHSTTIDDDKEGTCVCTQCGLVLEQLYMLNCEHLGDGRSIEENIYFDVYNIYIFLKDACENASISYNMISYSISYFKLLKKDETIKEKKFSDVAIASYALYETLCRHHIPRTAQEIEYFTNIPCSIFWKIEACLEFTETLHNPQDYVERYCALLNMTYYETRMIRGIVGNLYGMGDIKPSCLIACVIYLYCKEIGKKMTRKNICEVCFVSTGNITKLTKKLRIDFVQQISLLYS